MTAASARRYLLLLLGIALAVYLVPVWWGLPDYQTWAFDEMTPSNVLRPNAWPTKYPPLHRYLLRVVLTGAEWLGSSVLPEISPVRSYSLLVIAGRALSAVMATGILYFLYRMARLLFDRRAALIAAAALAFSPTLTYYGKTSNLEAPYVFWFALSMFFYIRSLTRRRTRDLALFAVCGVLSVCSKDQVVALYALTPFVLAASLASERRGGLSSYLAAFLDRRMLMAAAAAVATFLAVYKGIFASPELGLHLQTLASPDWEVHRFYPLTAGGQLRMLWQTLVNLEFLLGAPFLLAAVVGLVRAARAPRENSLLLGLLLLPLPYYFGPILITGYNLDRHLLAVAVLLTPFVAKGAAALWESERIAPALRAALVILVIGHSLARAITVDWMMVTDARYRAERWLESSGHLSRTIAIGARPMLPRGVPLRDWKLFTEQVASVRSLPPGAWHDCWALESLDADYVVVDYPGTFLSPGMNYRVFKRIENPAPYEWLRVERATSNLDKIAREVVVFARTEERCIEDEEALRTLDELPRQPDPERRARLHRQLDRQLDQGDAIELHPLLEDRIQAFGISADGWSRGQRAAGVIVHNRGDRRWSPELKVANQDATSEEPMTLFVEDGDSTVDHRLPRLATRWIPLSPVPPRSDRLFVLWTDRAWRPGTWDLRLRGVRLERMTRLEVATRESLEAIGELRQRPDAALRAEIAAAIAQGKVSRASLSPTLWALGLTHDGWTRGSLPAGVVVANPGAGPLAPRLRLTTLAGAEVYPLTVFIEDGETTSEILLRRRGTVAAPLAPVAAGSRRLYIVWSDKSWSPESDDGRALGVRLRP